MTAKLVHILINTYRVCGFITTLHNIYYTQLGLSGMGVMESLKRLFYTILPHTSLAAIDPSEHYTF